MCTPATPTRLFNDPISFTPISPVTLLFCCSMMRRVPGLPHVRRERKRLRLPAWNGRLQLRCVTNCQNNCCAFFHGNATCTHQNPRPRCLSYLPLEPAAVHVSCPYAIPGVCTASLLSRGHRGCRIGRVLRMLLLHFITFFVFQYVARSD